MLRVILGKRLQHLREKAGLAFEEAARTLDATHATVRRMEKAETGLKIPYVEKLLRLYAVAPEEIHAFLALARQGNRPGETVPRCPIGGPAVMPARLDRLIEPCARPAVRLRVVPFAAGPHRMCAQAAPVQSTAAVLDGIRKEI